MTKRPTPDSRKAGSTTGPHGSRFSARLKLQALAVASAFGSFAATVHGNPVNPVVVNGQATFNAAGNTLTITNSPGAVINWQSFSIGASEITKFQQQSASSAVLNRVVGADPSSILGQLISNGKVFLINPNGIVFGQGARIDVAGLVASTSHISTEDFLSGKLKFQAGVVQGTVVNQGSINAAPGGTILLVGKDVSNSGIIQAPNGQIILAAGTTVEVIDTTTPGVKVVFTADANKAENLGTLTGQNINIAGSLLRNKGIINANQVSRDAQGRIVLSASRSVTLESGSTITANGPQGGSVTVSAGNDIKVEGNTLTQANGSAGPGGTISLKSTEGSISVDTGALIQANGSANANATAGLPNSGQAGGFITLQATKGTTTVAGNLEARGVAAPTTAATTPGTALGAALGELPAPAAGGTVQVLGQNVTLTGNATIDASGTDGGGTILIGGDYQGKNPDIQNALMTFVDRNVILKADADLKGDGGKVIVWADNATHFTGSLLARGGRDGGHGGVAEVSGKDFLYFSPRGSVDLSAPNGKRGTLLLDPLNITISSGPADINGDSSTGDDISSATALNASGIYGGSSSVITNAALAGVLNNADVTLQASNNITVNAAINSGSGLSLTADRTLTLQAANSIDLLNSISAAGSAYKLNLNFSANSSINVTAGAQLLTNGGFVTLNAGVGTFTNGGTINTGAGGGIINIIADNANLLSGSVLNTTGVSVFIRPFTASRTINLGTGAGGLDLSNTELGTVVSASLTIGSAGQTGDINAKAAATPAGLPALVLIQNPAGGGKIYLDDSGGSTALNVSAANLVLSAGTGGIVANASTAVAELQTSGTVSMDTTGSMGTNTNAIQFAGGATPGLITIGANAVPTSVKLIGPAFMLGNVTTNGDISIFASGNVIVSGNVNAGAGRIEIGADAEASPDGVGTFGLAAGKSIVTTNTTRVADGAGNFTGVSAIFVSGADIDLQGTVTPGAGGDVSLFVSQAGRTVGLGAAAGAMSLSNTELNNVVVSGAPGTGILHVGGLTSGAVNVSAVNVTARMAVISGSTIDDVGAGTAITTTSGLGFRAAGAIGGASGGGDGFTFAAPSLGLTNTGGANATFTSAAAGDIYVGRLVTGGAGNVTLTKPTAGNINFVQNAGFTTTDVVVTTGSLNVGAAAGSMIMTAMPITAGSINLSASGPITGNSVLNTSAANGAINLTGSTIGASGGANRINVNPGTGMVNATSLSTGVSDGVFLNQTVGNILASRYNPEPAGTTPIEVSTSGGNIVIDIGLNGPSSRPITMEVGGSGSINFAPTGTNQVLASQLNLVGAGSGNTVNFVSGTTTFNTPVNTMLPINLTGGATFTTGTSTLAGAISGTGTITINGSGINVSPTAGFSVGALNVSAGTISFGAGNPNIGSFTQSGGAVTGTGILSVGTAFNQTGGAISGPFSDINILQAAGNMSVSAMTATNTINLSATSGAITDANGAGTNNLAAPTVNLKAAAGIDLDTTATTVNLSATAASTQSVRVPNALTLNAASAGGAINVSASGAVILGTVSTAGALNLSAGSAVTQTGTVSVAGTTSLSTAAGGITLTQSTNDFGTINASATAGSIALVDANSVVLGAMAAPAGNLSVSANGGITQSGPLLIANVNITGGTGVTLNHTGNTFSSGTFAAGTGALNATTSSALAIGSASGVGIGLNANGISNAGTIAAGGGAVALNAGTGTLSTGTITNAGNTLLLANVLNAGSIGATNITVTAPTASTVTFTGGLTASNSILLDDLTLTAPATFVAGAGGVQLYGVAGAGQNLTIQSAGSIAFNAAAVVANLNATATAGQVTQAAPITASTINVTGATGITLNNAGNTIAGATLSAGSGAVALHSSTNLSLAALSGTASAATISSAGAISNSGTTTANGLVVFSGTGVANSGSISGIGVQISSGTGSLNTGTISGTTGAVYLVGDSLGIAGSISGAAVTLAPYTAGTAVALGSGGGYMIPSAAFGSITGPLTISSGGPISVNSGITYGNSLKLNSPSTISINANVTASGALNIDPTTIGITGATIQGSSVALSASGSIALTGSGSGPAGVVATSGNISMSAPGISYTAGSGNGAYINAVAGSALLTVDSCIGCTTLATNPTVSSVGSYASLGVTMVSFTPGTNAVSGITGSLINQTISSTTTATTSTSTATSSSTSSSSSTVSPTNLVSSSTTSSGSTSPLTTTSTGTAGDSFNSFVSGSGSTSTTSGTTSPSGSTTSTTGSTTTSTSGTNTATTDTTSNSSQSSGTGNDGATGQQQPQGKPEEKPAAKPDAQPQEKPAAKPQPKKVLSCS